MGFNSARKGLSKMCNTMPGEKSACRIFCFKYCTLHICSSDSSFAIHTEQDSDVGFILLIFSVNRVKL